jgi:hypothetical protein
MAALKDKQKYFQELLAAKFNKEDLSKIAKSWGRTDEESDKTSYMSRSYMMAW